MKRIRSDSTAAAVKSMQAATRAVLEPPEHVQLRDVDLPFWDAVIRSRARDEWTPTDLILAAQLARAQADVEREQATLDTEGTVIVTGAGRSTANPRASLIDGLCKREMALLRTLRMGGRVAGDARDGLKAAQLERRSRLVLDEFDDDGLIAR